MALSRVGLVGYDSVSNAQIAANTIIPEDVEDRSLTSVKLAIPQSFPYSANVTGNASINRSLAVGYVDGRVPQANLDVKGNVFISGVTTGATFEPTGDTAASDKAAIGYTGAEGLILTGQGSTGDVTIKNDADATVAYVPTGADDLLFPDNAGLIFGTGSDLKIYHDASNSYIKDSGTGALISWASANYIRGSSGEDMIKASTGGAVEAYYANSKKMETATDGVSVTGAVYGDSGSQYGWTQSVGVGDANVTYNSWAVPAGTGGIYHWQLPGAGTYLLMSSWRVRLWDEGGMILSRIYNQSNSFVIPGGVRMNWEMRDESLQTNVQISDQWIHKVTAAANITHQAFTDHNSTASSIQSDANGFNTHIWYRVG